MRPNAPKAVTLLLSLVLGVVAVLNYFSVISVFPEYNFFILLGTYVLLLLGVILKAL